MSNQVKGGDITQLLIAGKEFFVQTDANVNLMVGGKATTTALNGNGSPHNTQRRRPGGFTDCPISCDDSEGDLEDLQAVSDEGNPVTVSMTLASGETYQGSLSMATEDEVLTKATGDGIVSISMKGAKFERI